MTEKKKLLFKDLNIDNIIYLISLVGTTIIFSPILLGYNLPLWSTDNLFGTYPFLEISSEMIINQSSWFPFLGRGMDFSASVNNQAFSPIIRPLLHLGTSDRFFFISLLTFLSFFLTPVISFYIIRNIVDNSYAAVISSILIQFSLTSLFYLMIFPTIFLQLFFLISIYLIQLIKTISVIRCITFLSVSLSCLFLTGHPVYVFYFFMAIIFFFFLEIKLNIGEKKKIIFVFITSLIISLMIGCVKFYPFLVEVINGSRIEKFLIPEILFRPLFYLNQFFPDIHGVTNDKMNHFSNFNAGIGTLNERLAFHQGHIWTYIGILPFSFIVISFFYGKFTIWKFISLIFIIELIFPFFQTISNTLLYPFQKNSHLYLASFFWSISFAFALKDFFEKNTKTHLSNNLFLIKKFTTFWLVVISIFLFVHFFDINNYLQKLIIFLFLIFFLIIPNFVKFIFNNKFYFMNFLIIFSILSILILFFITPVARFVYLNYLTSIIFLFYFLKNNNYKDLYLIKRYLITFFIATLLIYLFYFILFVHIPTYSEKEDFFLKDYFRIRNIYYEISNWKIEFFVIILISFLKFILIFLNFHKLLKFNSSKKFLSILIIIMIDIFPVFLTKTLWVSKPFVKADYKSLFSEKKLDNKNFNFRFSNIHQTIPINNLFDKRVEGEILSNLPYSLNIPSYGGVNSQFTKREIDFYNSYIENKNNKLLFPNEILQKDIGLHSNFNDKNLLRFLGVKYIFKNNNIVSIDNALSRFMIFYSFKYKENPKEIGKLVSNGLFNFNKSIILEKNLNFKNSNKIAKVLNYETLNYDSLRVNIKDCKSCILLFNDTYNKNWRAFDDKNNELKIFPANGISMGVKIESNTEYINLYFKKFMTFYEVLKIINLIATFLVLILFILIFFEYKILNIFTRKKNNRA